MAAIDYLTQNGLSARVAGKRLVVSPASKLTEEDRQYIKLHRLELIAELAANDGKMRSSNWKVLRGEKVICVMIGEPMTRQEALEAARWRWIDSDVR